MIFIYLRIILLLATMTAAPGFAAENHTAEGAAEAVDAAVNTVLFSEGEQSWTLRDFNLYKKILRHIPKKNEDIGLFDSVSQEFLISRLLNHEAQLFEIQPEKLELNAGSKTDLAEYSKAEINDELKAISFSRALLDLKESQMRQKIRFKAWIEVLKRKYAVKIKANDFAKSLR